MPPQRRRGKATPPKGRKQRKPEGERKTSAPPKGTVGKWHHPKGKRSGKQHTPRRSEKAAAPRRSWRRQHHPKRASLLLWAGVAFPLMSSLLWMWCFFRPLGGAAFSSLLFGWCCLKKNKNTPKNKTKKLIRTSQKQAQNQLTTSRYIFLIMMIMIMRGYQVSEVSEVSGFGVSELATTFLQRIPFYS